eukprot:gnl/TRDRNA2_/TRDRNA2_85372_c1_seq1.p1 gnl/TRDRNA2_/TRDRNA2_85372_c1~~gnl/TRDRNA2_/TRDRNA2_85372_c1_seq1.p1  ORF type:complete len:427 (-),score=35.55 gnl/TRDRNA2_/TRDRNA2_85372_c1_seq1:59-1261(-)
MAQAQGQQPMAKHITDLEAPMDDMNDKLFDRMMKRKCPRPADLDSTTNGKLEDAALRGASYTGTTPTIPRSPTSFSRTITYRPTLATRRVISPRAVATPFQDVVQSETIFDGLGEAQIKVLARKDSDVNSLQLKFRETGLPRKLHLGNDTLMELHWAEVGENGSWALPSTLEPHSHHGGDGFSLRTHLGQDGSAILTFPYDHMPQRLAWVLHIKSDGEQRWLKSQGGRDSIINMADAVETAERGPSRIEHFEGLSSQRAWLKVHARTGPARSLELYIRETGVRRCLQVGENARMYLHWAAVGRNGCWEPLPNPPPNAHPSGSGFSFRTQLEQDGSAVLTFPHQGIPSQISFVLLVQDNGQKHWLKARGGNGDFTINMTDTVRAAESNLIMSDTLRARVRW